MSERTVWRRDGLETAELGQAQLVAPERDGVGTPCPPCWDLLSCWTEYWTCHSSVMRRLLCLELIEFKSPQWQNMHRKGLMCINTDILKCNRCILLREMYRLQRNYSNSYSPITGKCIKKIILCGYFCHNTFQNSCCNTGNLLPKIHSKKFPSSGSKLLKSRDYSAQRHISIAHDIKNFWLLVG